VIFHQSQSTFMNNTRSKVHFENEEEERKESETVVENQNDTRNMTIESEFEFKDRLFKFDYVKIGKDLDLKMHGF
jgi:hypothetical protein